MIGAAELGAKITLVSLLPLHEQTLSSEANERLVAIGMRLLDYKTLAWERNKSDNKWSIFDKRV